MENPQQEKFDSGLAGFIAAETVLSHSDGARGILWVRGHTLPDLVARFGYDGAVGLLWEGFAGEGLDRDLMRARLGAGRVRAFDRLGGWLPQARGRSFIEGVRLALASLPEDSEPAEILATLPVAIAALLRDHRGMPPLPPDPARGTADDLLRMTHGHPVAPVMAEALDTYFAASSTTASTPRPLRRGSSRRAAHRWSRPRSAPIARLPGHCTAARRVRRWICSTRPKRAAMLRHGPSASSPPGSG